VAAVPRDLSEPEWTLPTNVHHATHYEFVIATYKFSFLLLFASLLLNLMSSLLSDMFVQTVRETIPCARVYILFRFHKLQGLMYEVKVKLSVCFN